jgi:hypothetical protein
MALVEITFIVVMLWAAFMAGNQRHVILRAIFYLVIALMIAMMIHRISLL